MSRHNTVCRFFTQLRTRFPIDWFWFGLVVGLVLVIGGSITLFVAKEIKGDTLRIVVGIIGATIAGFGGLVTTSAWSYRSGESQKSRFEASIAKNKEMIKDMVNESIEKQRHLMEEEREARKHRLISVVATEAQGNYYLLRLDVYKTGNADADATFPTLHSEAMTSALTSGLFLNPADRALHDYLHDISAITPDFNQKMGFANDFLLHNLELQQAAFRKLFGTDNTAGDNVVKLISRLHIGLLNILSTQYGIVMQPQITSLLSNLTATWSPHPAAPSKPPDTSPKE